MPATCEICGSTIDAGAPVVRLSGPEAGAVPALSEAVFDPARDGALAYYCAAHADAVRRIRELMPATAEVEQDVRGRLYQELDLLAYALEMETDEALARGDEAAAERAQQTRLGVRLAARLVGGVPAPEVDDRIRRWRSAYEARFPA